MLNPILSVLIPVKTSNYIFDYFKNIELLKNKSNRQVCFMFKMMFIILTYKGVHFVFLGLYPLSLGLRILNCDIFYLAFEKPLFDAFVFVVCLEGIYNLQILYFHYDTKEIDSMKNIFLYKNYSFFITSKYKCNKNIEKVLHNFYLKLINIFCSPLIILGKAFVCFWFKI